jgi:hypothetical protein
VQSFWEVQADQDFQITGNLFNLMNAIRVASLVIIVLGLCCIKSVSTIVYYIEVKA